MALVARAQVGGRDGGSRREKWPHQLLNGGDCGLSRWRQGKAIPTDGGKMGKEIAAAVEREVGIAAAERK
uniref:Uncharacterized protein n=1 Tax=Oryza rufipogon TaxID=4529 RepID=A0A0E0MY00_ORYRU